MGPKVLSQPEIEDNPRGDNHTIGLAIQDTTIQDPVDEDPAARDPLIEGEAFQKVVMDVKVTTRGSDGCWQADPG